MSLGSLSMRNIDPVRPGDSNSFQIGLIHWQDGLLWGPAVGGTEGPAVLSEEDMTCNELVRGHLSFRDGSLQDKTTAE